MLEARRSNDIARMKSWQSMTRSGEESTASQSSIPHWCVQRLEHSRRRTTTAWMVEAGQVPWLITSDNHCSQVMTHQDVVDSFKVD